MSDQIPAPLGSVAHYTLLERLDPAGPGDLFRARDTHRGRTVAIRILPESIAPDSGSRAELVQQARALIPLSHPNIVTLFDAGPHADRVYLAFEFLKGQSLRAEMAGRPVHVRRALEIAIQIADAVSEAHAAGFAHGGLSADSVMITAKGHAKIPTYHLATQVGFDPAVGDATLHDYVSPEEARGEQADDRSDVYSIAAVLYEMLTTRRPHPRGIAAPSASNPRIPAELDDLLQRALAPNPASRTAGAAILASELRAIASALSSGAVDDEDVPVPSSRRGAGVLIAVAVLIVLAVLGWWLTRS